MVCIYKSMTFSTNVFFINTYYTIFLYFTYKLCIIRIKCMTLINIYYINICIICLKCDILHIKVQKISSRVLPDFFPLFQ